MKWYVISLDRTPERYSTFRRANSAHGYIERFPAVDGRHLNLAELGRQGLADMTLTYTKGAIGNALTHRALWQRAVEDNEAITVFEDDAYLHDQFASASERLLSQLPPNWDIVLWGWNFDSGLIAAPEPRLAVCLMRFNQAEMREHKSGYLRGKPHSVLLRLHACFGTVSYSISPSGARKFLQRCFPLHQFVLSIPDFGINLQSGGLDAELCRHYQSTESRVCFPPLVVTDNDSGNSTVQTG